MAFSGARIQVRQLVGMRLMSDPSGNNEFTIKRILERLNDN
jgi:hypothetical protein